MATDIQSNWTRKHDNNSNNNTLIYRHWSCWTI